MSRARKKTRGNPAKARAQAEQAAAILDEIAEGMPLTEEDRAALADFDPDAAQYNIGAGLLNEHDEFVQLSLLVTWMMSTQEPGAAQFRTALFLNYTGELASEDGSAMLEAVRQACRFNVEHGRVQPPA